MHAGVLGTASFHLALVCKHVHTSLHYAKHPHTPADQAVIQVRCVVELIWEVKNSQKPKTSLNSDDK